jgi:hypothetical protein
VSAPRSPRSDAAAIAFLGGKPDLEALARLQQERGLLLMTVDGAHAHLDGDAGALVTELIRLARLGVLVGVEAQLRPDRAVAQVVREAEQTVRRP